MKKIVHCGSGSGLKNLVVKGVLAHVDLVLYGGATCCRLFILYGAEFCEQRTIFSFFAELVYLTRQGGKHGGVGWLMPVVLFLWRVGCPSGQVEPMFNLANWLVDELVLWGR